MKKKILLFGLSLLTAVVLFQCAKLSQATVSSQVTQTISALGNGSTVNYTIGFPFQDNDYIEVYLQSEATTPYTRTKLVYGAGTGKFTITGGDPGTTVVMGTAPSATQRVVIKRVTPKTQAVTYSETAAFPATEHEAQMDKEIYIAQENARELGNKVGLAEGSAASPVPTIPDPQADRFLVYNHAGNDFTVTPSPAPTSGNVLKYDGDSWELYDIDTALANLGSSDSTTKAELDAHKANTSNPHSVTHLQLPDRGTTTHVLLDAHVASSSNPHSVTHSQLSDKGTNDHAAIDSHLGSTSNPHSVTAAQVGNSTAQWNADKIKGKTVNDSAIGDGKVLSYNSGTGQLEYATTPVLSSGSANQIYGRNAGNTDGEWKDIVGTTDQITVTHSANTVTLATPQNIAPTSSPTFFEVIASLFTGSVGYTQADPSDWASVSPTPSPSTVQAAIDELASQMITKVGPTAVVSPVAGDHLAWTGSAWTNSNSTSSGGQVVTQYLDDTASDIGGYVTLSTTPVGGVTVTDTIVVNSGGVVSGGETYITPLGGLGGTQIDGGLWNPTFFADVDNATGTTQLVLTFKRRNLAGTETTLFTTTSPDINNTSVGLVDWETVQSAFSTGHVATDRLVMVVSAQTTTGANRTVRFYHNGTTTYSHVHTPLVLRHNTLSGLEGCEGGVCYHTGATTLTSKGDLLSHTGVANTRLSVGTNGYVLTADSTTGSGLKWAASAAASADGAGAVQYSNGSGGFLGSTTKLFVADATGRVGIGTASPGDTLDVRGNIQGQLDGTRWTMYNTAGTKKIQFGLSGAGSAFQEMMDDSANSVILLRPNATSYINGQALAIGATSVTSGSKFDVKGKMCLPGATSGAFCLSPAAAAGSVTYTPPAADGLADSALTSNGSATLAFRPITGADEVSNLSIAASVGSSALTIAIKGKDGNDPSATNPVYVGFRSATATSGVYVTRSITSALSVVVPNGAELGSFNGVAQFLWVYLIDNAGTVELAVAGSDYPYQRGNVITTTTIGTGSDSGIVAYSTTGRSDVAVQRIGRILITGGNTGAWTNSPTRIEVGTYFDINVDVAQDYVAFDWAVTGNSGLANGEYAGLGGVDNEISLLPGLWNCTHREVSDSSTCAGYTRAAYSFFQEDGGDTGTPPTTLDANYAVILGNNGNYGAPAYISGTSACTMISNITRRIVVKKYYTMHSVPYVEFTGTGGTNLSFSGSGYCKRER